MERIDTDVTVGISTAFAELAIAALLTLYVWTGVGVRLVRYALRADALRPMPLHSLSGGGGL